MHTLTPLHWTELKSARATLNSILLNSEMSVTNVQWGQLRLIRNHINEILLSPSLPDRVLLPDPTLLP